MTHAELRTPNAHTQLLRKVQTTRTQTGQSGQSQTGQASHEMFLDRYYKWTSSTYDLTRKYFLFGRDRLLNRILSEPFDNLVEVGVGTGRNLAKLHRRNPSAAYFGVDASHEMLKVAKRNLPFAMLEHGFAETVNYRSLVGERPERVLFSYALSMFQDPNRAIDNALAQLGPNGRVVLVDFSDAQGMPRILREPFHKFLQYFHVNPILESQLPKRLYSALGPLRYFLVAELRP